MKRIEGFPDYLIAKDGRVFSLKSKSFYMTLERGSLMCKKMTELHLHSCHSLKDAVAIPDDLARRASELGYTSLNISEHGSLSSAYEHYVACKKYGLKPIIGVEMYEADDRTESKEHYHFLLIAKNKIGYLNLIKILADASKNGMYRAKPRTDHSVYYPNREGVISTTGCLASRVPRLIQRGEIEEAETLLKELSIQFDDFYVELQINDVPIQKKVNLELIKMAQKHGAPMIVTSDVHYTLEADKDTHTAMVASGRGGTLMDGKDHAYTGNTYFLQDADTLLKRAEEQGYDLAIIKEAIENTNQLAESIEEYGIGQDVPTMPIVDEAHRVFKEMVREGAKRKLIGKGSEYLERLRYEMSVIESRGYESYFIVVAEAIQWCRDNEIEVGEGRGSASGSLVANVMDIIDVDPIANGLFFERFLDVTREKFPDIDTDIEDDRRQEFFDHLRSKYGEANVAHIRNHVRLGGRSAMKEALKLYEIPFKESNEISKMIPENATIKEMVADHSFMKQVRIHCGKLSDKVIELALGLEGIVKSMGKHAGGILITPNPIWEYVPVSYDKGYVCDFDKDQVEHLNLVKFDFLGLKTLNIVGRTRRLIKKNYGIDVSEQMSAMDDPNVYKDFQRGDTITVFQFKSTGMSGLAKKVKPTKFEHLVAINALYRPATLSSGEAWLYADRASGKEKSFYENRMEENLLGETYNIITFQEQTMQIAHDFAGWDYGFGDKLRKSSPEQLEEMRDKFIDDSLANHPELEEEYLDALWDRVKSYMGYGFNKSHAVSYARLAYKCAWLKHHYPLEWFASNLQRANKEDFPQLVKELKDRGIKFIVPKIEVSTSEFETLPEENAIVFPLTMIEGFSQKTLEGMASADISNIKSFSETIVKRSVTIVKVASMFALGVLDCLLDSGQSRFDGFVEYCELNKKKKDVEKYKPLFEMKLYDLEKKYLGGYITEHPLDKFYFRDFFNEYRDGDEAITAGTVISVKKIRDKNQNQMAFASIETQYGVVELVVFAQKYQKVREFLVKDMLVLVTGKKQGNQIKVSKMKEVHL